MRARSAPSTSRSPSAPHERGRRALTRLATLERRLYASLARIEGAIGIDELLSAVSEDPRARALLDRGNRERLASVRGRCAPHGSATEPAR